MSANGLLAAGSVAIWMGKSMDADGWCVVMFVVLAWSLICAVAGWMMRHSSALSENLALGVRHFNALQEKHADLIKAQQQERLRALGYALNMRDSKNGWEQYPADEDMRWAAHLLACAIAGDMEEARALVFEREASK